MEGFHSSLACLNFVCAQTGKLDHVARFRAVKVGIDIMSRGCDRISNDLVYRELLNEIDESDHRENVANVV